jgi:hypothetical protein
MLSTSALLAVRYGIATSWRQKTFLYTFEYVALNNNDNNNESLDPFKCALNQRTPRKTLTEGDLAVG